MAHLRETITKALEMPADTLGGVSSVSLSRRGGALIGGCRSILGYSDSAVTLRLCDGILTVTGKHLTMRSYGGGDMTIDGMIDSVTFSEGDDSSCQNVSH